MKELKSHSDIVQFGPKTQEIYYKFSCDSFLFIKQGHNYHDDQNKNLDQSQLGLNEWEKWTLLVIRIKTKIWQRIFRFRMVY